MSVRNVSCIWNSHIISWCSVVGTVPHSQYFDWMYHNYGMHEHANHVFATRSAYSVCYNIDYNCTNTCITYEALNVSEIYCNTNSTFQCNTSATATLQCYYDDRDVENTLSTTNDDYSNKLIGIHWTFSVFLVLSVLVGFFAVVFRCLCDCTEQQDPCLRYNHTCYKLLCRCSLVD